MCIANCVGVQWERFIYGRARFAMWEDEWTRWLAICVYVYGTSIAEGYLCVAEMIVYALKAWRTGLTEADHSSG